MKREDQIDIAARTYADKDGDSPSWMDMYDGFIAGAEWADQHPHWISVKDELPKHDTKENGLVSFPIVLVCLCDGYKDTSYYDDIGEEWSDYDGEVEYWMPLPEAPRKEDKK